MANTFPTNDEVKATFELCDQRGFKVVAYAGGPDGIKRTVHYGTHTLEHGYQLDDEAIKMFASSPTYFVSILSRAHMNRGE